jgi:hypothetical protein
MMRNLLRGVNRGENTGCSPQTYARVSICVVIFSDDEEHGQEEEPGEFEVL